MFIFLSFIGFSALVVFAFLFAISWQRRKGKFNMILHLIKVYFSDYDTTVYELINGSIIFA